MQDEQSWERLGDWKRDKGTAEVSVRLKLSLLELCCCLIRDSEQSQTCVSAGTLGLIVLRSGQAGFGFLRNVWPSQAGDKELHCIDQTQLRDAGVSPGGLLSPQCRADEGLQSPDLCSSGTQPWHPASPMGSATTTSSVAGSV